MFANVREESLFTRSRHSSLFTLSYIEPHCSVSLGGMLWPRLNITFIIYFHLYSFHLISFSSKYRRHYAFLLVSLARRFPLSLFSPHSLSARCTMHACSLSSLFATTTVTMRRDTSPIHLFPFVSPKGPYYWNLHSCHSTVRVSPTLRSFTRGACCR